MAKKQKMNSKDVGVQNMVKLMQDCWTDKTEKDKKNEEINNLLREAYDVSQPTSPRYLTAQKLRQAMWKTMGRTKTHDFAMHATPEVEEQMVNNVVKQVLKPIPQGLEEFVTEGFATVLNRARDAETFAGKNGIMFSSYLYGNGYRMIGRKGQKTFPVEFITITNSNLYLAPRSTGLRRGNKPTTRAAAVFSGTQDEFNALFPDHASDLPLGKLPRTNFESKENDMTWKQKYDDEDIVEWAYYFQIDGDEPMYRLVVGRDMTVIESQDGKDYPYSFDNEEAQKELYIPISDYLCDPTAEGVYSEGLGSILYRLATLGRMTQNMAYAHVQDNTHPHTLVAGLAPDQAGAFFKMVEMADKLAAQGKRGYIPVPSNPLGGGVQTTALLNPGEINSALVFLQMIDAEIKRNGVNLDEFDGEDPTEMQIRAFDENANAFVRQVGEYNAEQRKFELLVVLDLLKKEVKKSNKTPLNIKTSINGVTVKGATLGGLVDELKTRHYFFDINARSSAIPSNIMRRTQLQGTLSQLAPGSPEFTAVARQLAAFDGVELPAEAQPAAQPEAPEQAKGMGLGGALPPVPEETLQLTQ